MSVKLSKEASELVDEARSSLRPTDVDKARVAAGLHARLQAEAPVPHVEEPRRELKPAPNLTSSAARPWATKSWATKTAVLAGGAALSLMVASVYFRSPTLSKVVNTNAVVATSAVTASEEVVVDPMLLPPVETAPAPQGSAVRAAPQGSAVPAAANTSKGGRQEPGDRLAEEAALLRDAEKAFHAGSFTRTLALTNEHRTKFPKGLLVQERVHLRIQALCGLGRYDQANKEHARFKQSSGKTIKACVQAP